MTQIERTLSFTRAPFHTRLSAGHPCLREGDSLAAQVVATLRDSGRVLTGGDPPDLDRFEEARSNHRRALDRWAFDQLQTSGSPNEVLQGLNVDDALRAVSFFAVAMAQNAMVAAGLEVPDQLDVLPGVPVHVGLSGVARRILRTIRAHAWVRSSVLQTSLRTGVGLAVAVLISQLLRLDHAFWVVLGTLSVLRSNALSTGRTTLQALAGTIAGFVVAGAFTAAVGTTSPALWFALPVVVFLAAYGSTAFGFVAGQAGFTIVVIIVFNIIAPVGWRLGLARLEDVAIGASISVVVGLILWPRGARRELALELGGLYRSAAAFLDGCLSRVLEPGQVVDTGPLRSTAIRARDRAGEAMNHYLNERGAKPLAPETAAQLVAAGTDSILFGDLFERFASSGYRINVCPESASLLRGQLRVLTAAWSHLADRIERSTPDSIHPRVSDDEILRAEIMCLARWHVDKEGELRPSRPSSPANGSISWVR